MSEVVKKSYGVLQYCTSVKNLLKTRVPAIWVHGVLTQITPRGNLVYLGMAEYAEGQEKPIATISLTCYMSDWIRLHDKLARLAQPFELNVEMKVSLLLEADFYAPQGKFQPRILDIDPNYTLGEMAQTRMRILEVLKSDGLLDLNRMRPLAIAPLSVGLITAPHSAAYNDFCNVLNLSGFTFSIVFAEAKMQGADTEKTVVQALKYLESQNLDVICIVRGGGSKTDLVYFDSEAICRAIAKSSVPILTGIGHQIDSSLADRVAYDNKITPTDCARFLVDRVGEQYSCLELYQEKLRQKWLHTWGSEKQKFENLTLQIPKRFRLRLIRENQQILNLQKQIFQNWKNRFFNEKVKLAAAPQQIQRVAKRIYARELDRLEVNANGLLKGSKKITHLHTQLLEEHRQKLLLKSLYRFNLFKQNIENFQKRLHWADPKRLLSKGFVLLSSSQTGKVIHPQNLQEKEEIQIQTEHFIAHAQIQNIDYFQNSNNNLKTDSKMNKTKKGPL